MLIALPWGGSSLAEASEQQTTELLQEVDKYMELRPCKLNSALRPFFEGEDPASTSDSGSASFLGQVRLAVAHHETICGMQQSRGVIDNQVLNVHSYTFHARIQLCTMFAAVGSD